MAIFFEKCVVYMQFFKITFSWSISSYVLFLVHEGDIGYEVGGKSTYPLQNPEPTQFENYECRASKKLGAAQLLVEVKGIGMLLLL